MTIAARKKNHIEVCLGEDVRSKINNGFERYRLIHNALPEADFESFSAETEFLGKKISAPILISSMTGGTEQGEQINRNLLAAAAELNIPFAIGSQRIYLVNHDHSLDQYRKISKNIPILANVGAVQMNYGFTRDDLLRAVEMLEADALILHLNPLQELLQDGGDTDFSGLLKKIENICRNFPVPIIVKEVGWGISCNVACKLRDAGVSVIDVAGAGGTSWSQVESLISADPAVKLLAEPFAGWGIPTADCIRSIHEMDPNIKLIASGGLSTGVDAAKAILLGASLAGFAGRLLPGAVYSDPEKVSDILKLIIQQYKIARFVSSGIEECV